MKSIRTYLLLALMAIMTLVIFVSLLQGYNASINKAHQLFDNRLKNMAEIIASVNQDTFTHKTSQFQSSSLFFQIWNNDLSLLVRSNNAPLTMVGNIHSGNQFNNINFARYRWRIFILRDTLLQRWIITGEREDIRYSLAEDIVLSSIVPVVLAIPVGAFIIWFAVGLGLKPLKNLSVQLSRKQVDDLTPINLHEMPKELSQLVVTINALLNRLHNSFIREQQFSADAAHELRTPISLLKVQLHNLQVENKKQLDLRPLSDGIERMGLVIEQILSLYRHSPDQLTAKEEDVDLYSMTQQIMANYYDQFAAKEQRISLSGEEGMTVRGNQFALETLIQNIITNASKYTPNQGEIKIEIVKKNDFINVIIEDSGPGIPQDLRERVFERFYRVHGDRHNSGILGSGLGLAIVKLIADLHHAKITLHTSATLGGLQLIINFPAIHEINNV